MPTLTRKNNSVLQAGKAPAAPPVYRPQTVPRVLQKKTPAAPPVYRPQPAPKVLQTKAANKLGVATPALYKPPPPSQPTLNSRTIQKAELTRKPFTSATQKAVPLPKGSGQHRRHIISNHLMKEALQGWIKAHPNDPNINTIEQLYEQMNNYTPNLIPGPGAENTAIGMFTNAAAQKRKKFEAQSSTPQEMQKSLGEFTGFQQPTQKRLISPALEAFTNDPSISQNRKAALQYAADLQDSTDFDWPVDPKSNLFPVWREAYFDFLRLKNNPQAYEYRDLMKIANTFLQLPKPAP